MMASILLTMFFLLRSIKSVLGPISRDTNSGPNADRHQSKNVSQRFRTGILVAGAYHSGTGCQETLNGNLDSELFEHLPAKDGGEPGSSRGSAAELSMAFHFHCIIGHPLAVRKPHARPREQSGPRPRQGTQQA